MCRSYSYHEEVLFTSISSPHVSLTMVSHCCFNSDCQSETIRKEQLLCGCSQIGSSSSSNSTIPCFGERGVLTSICTAPLGGNYRIYVDGLYRDVSDVCTTVLYCTTAFGRSCSLQPALYGCFQIGSTRRSNHAIPWLGQPGGWASVLFLQQLTAF